LYILKSDSFKECYDVTFVTKAKQQISMLFYHYFHPKRQIHYWKESFTLKKFTHYGIQIFLTMYSILHSFENFENFHSKMHIVFEVVKSFLQT